MGSVLHSRRNPVYHSLERHNLASHIRCLERSRSPVKLRKAASNYPPVGSRPEVETAKVRHNYLVVHNAAVRCRKSLLHNTEPPARFERVVSSRMAIVEPAGSSKYKVAERSPLHRSSGQPASQDDMWWLELRNTKFGNRSPASYQTSCSMHWVAPEVPSRREAAPTAFH